MILHVDMDAFYASVEQRDRPELRGKPVIVGGSAESRGVVCAASYEARKFGVHSAMPTAVARRLCPQAIILPVRMANYASVARQVREILVSFTPLVEPLSLDEAFLDVHGCERLFGPPLEMARAIKRRIRLATALVASVGGGPNKFVAKLASDFGKPDGLVIVEPNRMTEFLAPLEVGRVWGVGAKAQKRLHDLGIHTIGQLAAIPVQVLTDSFGEAGRYFNQLAHGLDSSPVVPDAEAKSISTETTFARDIGERRALRSWLLELTEYLAERLRHSGVRARTIELKLRSSDFRTNTRSLTLREPSDVTAEIWQAVATLFDRRIPNSLLPARLIGVGAAGLQRSAAVQQHLFDQHARAKQYAVDGASDQIRERFGTDAIHRAGALSRPSDPPR